MTTSGRATDVGERAVSPVIDLRDFAGAGLQLLRSAWRRKLAVLAILALCLLPLLRSTPPEYVIRTGLVFDNDFASIKLMRDVLSRLTDEAWLNDVAGVPGQRRPAGSRDPEQVSRILQTLRIDHGKRGDTLLLECRSADPHDGISAVRVLIEALEEHEQLVQQAHLEKYGLPSMQELIKEYERQVQIRKQVRRQIADKRARLLSAIRKLVPGETEANDFKAPVPPAPLVDPSDNEAVGLFGNSSFWHVMLQRFPVSSNANPLEADFGVPGRNDRFVQQLSLEISWLDSQIVDATQRIQEIHIQIQIQMQHMEPFAIPGFEMTQEPTTELVSRKTMLWVIFGALGFMLAGGFVFVADVLDDRFRSPEEVVELLHAPVLCSLRNKQSWNNFAFRKTLPPVPPHSLDDECIRTLDLALTRDNSERRVVLCASVRGGAAPVAAALAASGIRRGQRVLLIDANFRNRDGTQATEAPCEYGLGAVLRDERSIPAAVDGRLQQVGEGLTMLPVEDGEESPLELLASARMHLLLQWAEVEYHRTYVVLPPAFSYDDAAFAASSRKNVLLVVEPDSDSRREAFEATARLESFGGVLCGIVTVGTNHFLGWQRRCYRRGLSGSSASKIDAVPEMAANRTSSDSSVSIPNNRCGVSKVA